MADSEQPSEPKAEPTPPPPPATLGERLRAARLAQDLTVEQLATELRIEAKQLHALEENRFEKIGVREIPACGTPIEVLRHHGVDADSVAERIRKGK